MGAASRAMSAGRKPPRHAPKGTIEGGQFIGRSSITHALIRKLLGIDEDRQQGSAVGRFTSRGGSVASIALHPRRPRIDDRVRDPRTGKLGRVLTISPELDTRHFRPGETEPRAGQLHPAAARVRWDDGQEETRPLGELDDPYAQRPLPDPARTFHAERGPRPAQVDTAVVTGTPGRPRSAAERMREGLAAGRIDNDTATRLMRGESPASIVESRSPAGFRDAQRAKLSAADRAVVDGLSSDQQELYWSRRAAGQDHETAIGSAGAARKMAAPKPPRALAKPKRLGIDEFDGRPRSAWMADARKAGVKVPAGAPAHEVAWLTQEERVRSGALMGAGGFSTNPAIRASAERYLSGDTQGGIEDRVAALRAQHEARVAALGIDTSTPAPAKKATAAQRMSRAAGKNLFDAAAEVRRAGSEEDMHAAMKGVPAADLPALADELNISVPREARSAAARRTYIARTMAEHLNRSGGPYGRVEFKDEPSPAVAKMARGQRANASKVRQDLLATPHTERYAYLERLGLSQAQARALAKDLGVRGQERSATPEILGRVVSHFEVAGDEAALARLGDAPSPRPIEDYVDWQAIGRLSPAGEKAAAKIARGKTPSGPRPSGLPTKPTLTDFEDLADRISRLRTEEQRLEALQDLNAGELNRLAGRFPGGVGINPSGYMSHRQTALKIPAGLSLEERRRWLARELTPAEQRRSKGEGARGQRR